MKNSNMMLEAIKKVVELGEPEFDFKCEFYLRRIPDGTIYGQNMWRFYIRNKHGGGSSDYILKWDEEDEVFLSTFQFLKEGES